MKSPSSPYIIGIDSMGVQDFISNDFSISEAIILPERTFGLDTVHSAQIEPTQYSWTGAPG